MDNIYQIPIQLRFIDIDAMGHVNNSVYLSYFELGRLEFFKNILNVKTERDFSFIIARCEVNYYKPIDLKSPGIYLNMWCGDFGKKSFKFFYEITDSERAIKFADGLSVQVFYDYTSQQTIPIPEKFIESVKDYIRK